MHISIPSMPHKQNMYVHVHVHVYVGAGTARMHVSTKIVTVS